MVDHNIISDELTGDFDKSRAETLVNDMVEMSDVTGNPCIVQVFGQTEEAIVKTSSTLVTSVINHSL